MQKLHGFNNVKQIDGAGQSYAFFAFDELLKRDTFLKVYWYSEDYKDSLLLEPRNLSSLYQSSEQAKHHIVNLYTADKVKVGEDDYIILKMEYCQGQSLLDKIGEHGLSIYDAIDITKQICEGIHYLHSVKIAHRDIKPGNVMINGNNCKIIDLGSAIKLDDNDFSARINSVKTLYYAPYEVFPPKRMCYLSSDLYQIGVVFYEMINGKFKLPIEIKRAALRKCEKTFNKKQNDFDGYENTVLQEENIKYLSERGELMSELSPTQHYLPKELKKILKKATHWEMSGRYKSCIEFRAELSKLNIPNWKRENANEWSVKQWKNKDFKIEINSNKKAKVTMHSSITGKNNFRRVSEINDLTQAFEYINGM